MTLENAIQHFEQLADESESRTEIILYLDFLQLLDLLSNKSLTTEQVYLIEEKLSRLDLEPNQRFNKYHFRQALFAFKVFLNRKLSLTVRGYYKYLGIVYGGAIGLLLGIFSFSEYEQSVGVVLGISLGAVIGEIFATKLENQAKDIGNLIG
jgi:hypothetical protein